MKTKHKYSIVKNAILLCVLCSLILPTVGCQRKNEEAKETSIGVILPLTGSGSVWGQNAKKGIDLAVEEINSSGGISGTQIQVFYEDSQTLPKFAVAALNKHINNNDVQACIVDMVSSNVLAMAPVANREKIVLLSPGASSPKITDSGGSYVFRNWPSDALQGELNAQFAIEKMGSKSAAILYINNEYGVGLQGVFKSEFERLGGKVKMVESFEQGDGDFRSVLAKLKSEEVDVLYILAYPKEWPLIATQAKEIGIDVPFLGTESADDPSIVQNAKTAIEGLVYSVPDKPSETDERVSHFLTEFKKKYSEEPGITADAAYDAVYLITDAIRAKGNSGTEIRDYLFTVKDYSGAAGSTTFDENGDCIKPFVFKRIVGGKPIVIE